MPQVTACRACLAENLNMYRVTDSPYKEIYEKLTNAKLGTVYPNTFCYICVSILRKFRKFSTLAISSNVKLQEWYRSETERKPATQPLFTISTTTVEYVSTHNDTKDKVEIKTEKIDDTNGEDQTIQFIESTREIDRYETTPQDDPMDTSWSDDEPKLGTPPEEFEVPIVKLESKKRVKTEKTPKGRPGIKKSEITNHNNKTKIKRIVVKKEIKIKVKKTVKNIVKRQRKMIACELCNYKTQSRQRLLNHLQSKHKNRKVKEEKVEDDKNTRLVTQEVTCKIGTEGVKRRKLINCDYCNYTNDKKNRIKTHLKSKHPQIELTCNFCIYQASTQTDLLSHKISQHLKENVYTCDTCNFKTSGKRNLEKHMQMHMPKLIRCELCDYTCNRRMYLLNHIAVVHSTEKKYMCHICDYRCSLRKRLHGHLRTHKIKEERKIKCEFCGQRFTRKTHLTRHIRIHTGEKPYACPECGQRFNQDGAMKLHLKRHYK